MSYIGNAPISAAFLTDTFSGTGSQTAFTMTVAPANTSSIIVAITGVLQDPSTYSVSGTTLTFSAAPPSGTSNISVRYLGIPASGVTTTAYRTVTDTTATAGQTSFTIPSYTVGYLEVFRNGVYLPNADYTATTGTTVVLANAATAGDTITTISFYVSSVLNAIPNSPASVGSTNIVSGVSLASPTLTGTATATTITSPASTALTLQTNNGTTAITVDTSQNVGIGTTSPQSKLMSQPTGTFTAAGTTSNAGLHLTSSTTTGGLAGQSIVWTNYGTSGSAVQAYISACTYGSNFMAFSGNGSSEAMRLDSGGNLQVGGQYAVPPTTSFGRIVSSGIFQSGRTGTGSQPAAEFFNGNSNVGSIYTSGSNTSYNTSSDYRLKQDIAPITGALTKVALLKPSTYKWKVDGANGEGFIAHELAEVFPQAVTGEKDEVDEDDKPKYQSIDTSFLVATLTAAIQELKAELDELKAKVG